MTRFIATVGVALYPTGFEAHSILIERHGEPFALNANCSDVDPTRQDYLDAQQAIYEQFCEQYKDRHISIKVEIHLFRALEIIAV